MTYLQNIIYDTGENPAKQENQKWVLTTSLGGFGKGLDQFMQVMGISGYYP